MVPSDCDEFTYKVSGTGDGIVVGVGSDVAVGIMVGVAMADSGMVSGAVPHPERSMENVSRMISVRSMEVSSDFCGSLYYQVMKTKRASFLDARLIRNDLILQILSTWFRG